MPKWNSESRHCTHCGEPFGVGGITVYIDADEANDYVSFLEASLESERMENSWLRTQLSLRTAPDEDAPMRRGDEPDVGRNRQ